MHRIAAYGRSGSEVREITEVSEVQGFLKRYGVVWLDIVSPTEKEIGALGRAFGFHRLAVEDCLHTTQRSKVDNFEDHFFIILKVVDYNKKAEAHQLSMFVGKNYVVTVREKGDPDVLKPVYEKIALKNQSVIKNGTDYLCYLIIDEIVDSYLPILDKIDDEIEDVEVRIIASNPQDATDTLFKLKKDLLLLRKAIFPTMEMIACVQRGDLPNISRKNYVFFNDVYDHIVEVVDLLETSRELVSGALDIHMSKTQNAINEVAKMFAMFAIILMWPTVVGAIYGMNFKEIPELQWGIYGYLFSLGLMGVLMVITWIYFKRKRWV